ncbi:hypothetical protein HAZT_HAZT009374 [Hyalella azteca]|uniref:Helicase C-terminal domain-containing protein n=1 Tax=Hyalella azteca TaxID=294128 RepID=A0A6A0HCN8_HYAAZ|nr:hypothetical protein HAZT_HAZT009374 [Hyalella azteca]
MPDTVATYVHRVGRTGRCGRPGVAHTFFSQRNISKSVALVHLLQEAGQRVDPKLLYMAAKRRFTPYGDSEVFLPFVPEKTGVFLPFVPEKTGEVTSGEVISGEVTSGEVISDEVISGEVTSGEVISDEVI